jgi:hypothetical protein
MATKKGTGLAGWQPKKIEPAAREASEREARPNLDYKSMTYRLSKPEWARLNKFAIDLDKRVQGLIEHGLNLVFMEMGLPPLVEDDPMLAATLERKQESEGREPRAKAKPVKKEPTPIVEEAPTEEPQQVDAVEQQQEAV